MPDADLSSAAAGDRGMPVTLKPSSGRQGSLVCRLPLLMLPLVRLLSGCWVVVARYRNPTSGPVAQHDLDHLLTPAKIFTCGADPLDEGLQVTWRRCPFDRIASVVNSAHTCEMVAPQTAVMRHECPLAAAHCA